MINLINLETLVIHQLSINFNVSNTTLSRMVHDSSVSRNYADVLSKSLHLLLEISDAGGMQDGRHEVRIVGPAILSSIVVTKIKDVSFN